MKNYDCLILGAGIGGLTVGADLALRGMSVAVVDKSPFLGGRSRGEMIGDYSVDFGIHVLHHGSHGVGARVIKKLKLDSVKVITFGDPIMWVDGEFMPIPAKPDKIFTTSLISFGERLHLAYLILKTFLLNAERYDGMTLHDYLERNGCRDGRVYDFFSLIAGLSASAPHPGMAAAGETFRFFRRGFKSGGQLGYPEGGWLVLNQALEGKVKQGGDMFLRQVVRGLDIDSDGVTMNLEGGETLRGRACVLALPLDDALPFLDPAMLSERELGFMKNLEHTVGVSIDFGLKRPVCEDAKFVASFKPPTLGCFTSNFDPTTAPAGKQLGTWLLPMSTAEMNTPGAPRRRLNELKALLERMFPGIWDLAEWERPLILRNVDGCLNKPGQLKGVRPGPGIGRYTNVFVAGDSCNGDGNGGTIAFNSALDAARAVAGFLG